MIAIFCRKPVLSLKKKLHGMGNNSKWTAKATLYIQRHFNGLIGLLSSDNEGEVYFPTMWLGLALTTKDRLDIAEHSSK